MKEHNKDERLYNKNFYEAWKNAISGIFYSIKTQKNIQRQILISIFVIIISFLLKFSKIEFILIIFAIFLVVVAETINTAIETCVDLYTDKYHEKAKIAKDVGAGAVVLASINAIVVACIIIFVK